MNKILVLQVTGLIILSATLTGMLAATDIYDEVFRKIVDELCLSCMKVKASTQFEWEFDTANGKPHPSFVIENLSDGPVILTYRIDFCPGCDKLEQNVLYAFLGYEFHKDEVFYEKMDIDGSTVTFVHINTYITDDDSELDLSRGIYDVVGDEGNPMITLISYNYNQGFVIPTYATVYGLTGDTAEDQKNQFDNFVQEAIQLYNEHVDAY